MHERENRVLLYSAPTHHHTSRRAIRFGTRPLIDTQFPTTSLTPLLIKADKTEAIDWTSILQWSACKALPASSTPQFGNAPGGHTLTLVDGELWRILQPSSSPWHCQKGKWSCELISGGVAGLDDRSLGLGLGTPRIIHKAGHATLSLVLTCVPQVAPQLPLLCNRQPGRPGSPERELSTNRGC